MSQREFYSTEAEHGVLAALMLKPDLCEEIGAFLSASDFYHEDNRQLYGMILALHSRNVHPDAVSLSEYKPMLPSGESTIFYAGSIQSNIRTWANGKHLARAMMEKSLARRAWDKLEDMRLLLESDESISSVVSQWQNSLTDLSTSDGIPDVVSYREILISVIDKIDSRHMGDVPQGLEFGLKDLDEIVKCLRPGNLIIVAGKPGTGKTVIATGLADRIAIEEGKSALIFSLEMSKEELVNRTLSSVGGVEKDRIDSGKLADDDWPKLTGAVNKLTAADLRVCDKPALTFSRLCNIARFQHRAKPVDLIVVDYLTLIRPDATSRQANRSAEIGSFTRGLKALAKELGIPIVVIAQLNRAMDGRADSRPRLSDLRDSGEIEQDADVVVLGYRDEKSSDGASGLTEWDVAKCRHAKPGTCTIQFQGQYQRFVNAAKGDTYSHERSTKKAKSAMDNFTPGGFE